ncbi:uncharacterized protein LY89DRAFT_766502 [Mollisia scopiformis]|uniref:Transposase n=1 Tax=Mollisia scopiformis TaxID=149040 RepID=A0A132B4K7_MOLSC|nr:uncharacterized protein LY89DRAFT_766502 [Mollisia scopiformis]KUJ07332.1 hypothetical protein LY89DRAFT_766502 [Mollisia scopiformis]
MATTHQIPVLKQSKEPEFTRDQRLRIQTLFYDANLTRDQICLQTRHTYRQVYYTLQHPSQENRQTPWNQIPQILGWECGEYAIRTAFKREGGLTDEQWDEVLWSDKTWAQLGRHTRIRVIRRPEEKQNKDCMFWGSISKKYGRHRRLFWEKDWETINKGSYYGIIVLVVNEILQQYLELQFQQDLRVIEWPLCSLGFSLIKNLWDDMKDYIQEHYPKVHKSYKRLRQVVQKAWESITHERIRELVHSMRERCQAVIDADG